MTTIMRTMVRARRVVAAVSAVALSSCTVGPEFESPANTLPPQWRAPPAQVSANDVDVEWWKKLNDPALNDLVARALESNADVKIAALRVAQSRTQLSGASGARWPVLNVSGLYDRQRQSENGVSTRVIDLIVPPPQRDPIIEVLSEPFDVYQAGFDAAWELDLWGRVRRSVESADASLQASSEDLHAAQLSLIAEVVRTYLQLRGVQEQLRIANAERHGERRSGRTDAYRVKGGIADELDLSTQRTRLSDTRASIPVLQQRQAEILSALALLLNVEPGALDAQLAKRSAHIRATARRSRAVCRPKSLGGARTFAVPKRGYMQRRRKSVLPWRISIRASR